MDKIQKFTTEINGKELIVETGRYAAQSNGACTVQYGGTVVLATAVKSDIAREGMDYFPLMVDYEEKLYAAGKIKGSRFIKREGRASDEAVLTGRLIDRSLRPLFNQEVRNDVQVVATVLSIDQENDADVVALLASSIALSISDIPWNGPVAGARVGRVDGKFVYNPTNEVRANSDLDLIIVNSGEKVIMLEAGGIQVPEEDVLEAIKFSQKNILELIKFINDIQNKVGIEKEQIEVEELSDEDKDIWTKVEKKVNEFVGDKIMKSFDIQGKHEQKEIIAKLREDLDKMLKEDSDVSKEARAKGVAMIEGMFQTEARKLVLEQGRRVDGRAIDEIRELSCDVHLLPRTHGSGLFNRGETQVLSVVTLGSPGDEQTLDTMDESGTKRYMHHYNFPGFSVGEAKPLRGPGRRDIGHGALAEKALEPVLPSKEDFPYTIRVVSEVLSSNGSSSQASVCGSSLSLMDAGVPITEPVAGIAIGLITDYDNPKNYKILTDIQGVEDHDGDMDFKVAGTKNGITALQMDVKLDGVEIEVLKDAFESAKQARLKILEVMKKTIAEPNKELSEYAPRISSIKIDPEKIRDVIGKGGETINKIIDECGGVDVMKIDIEDDGLVMITSTDSAMAEKAIKWIKDLTREVMVGEVFEGTVMKIVTDRNSGTEIGAIVELIPGQDGMVHISQFSNERIAKVSDVVKEGDKLKVKVMGIDKERGRIELSHKVFASPVIPSAPSADRTTDRRQDRKKFGFKKPFRK
ncbi:MAG: polyribonucleotide nucleotidyltransferase [bacterium]|nr:polyribonucleotide nucleotidyltransferase [bacterium]